MNKESKQLIYLSHRVKKDFRIDNNGIICDVPSNILNEISTYSCNEFNIYFVGGVGRFFTNFLVSIVDGKLKAMNNLGFSVYKQGQTYTP